MKPNEISLNTPHKKEPMDDSGEDHIAGSADTPMRHDAFEMEDALKIELIRKHFKDILSILGLDLNDDDLKGTPDRVAHMFVNEIFSGLNPINRPDVKLLEHTKSFKEMQIEKDIAVYSYCEHHFVPIIGKAHIAYISNGNVLNLSTISKLTEHYCKRPQIQERLTMQIAQALKEVLQTDDVAVVIDAEHLCVSSRGVKDASSSTVTVHFSGKFKNEETKSEFLAFIHQ